jgi:hypothetical protein
MAGRILVGIDPFEAQAKGFDLAGSIVGPRGSFLGHIGAGGAARAALKGRGCGTAAWGPSANEPLHLELVAGSEQDLRGARDLAENRPSRPMASGRSAGSV